MQWKSIRLHSFHAAIDRFAFFQPCQTTGSTRGLLLVFVFVLVWFFSFCFFCCLRGCFRVCCLSFFGLFWGCAPLFHFCCCCSRCCCCCCVCVCVSVCVCFLFVFFFIFVVGDFFPMQKGFRVFVPHQKTDKYYQRVAWLRFWGRVAVHPEADDRQFSSLRHRVQHCTVFGCISVESSSHDVERVSLSIYYCQANRISTESRQYRLQVGYWGRKFAPRAFLSYARQFQCRRT